MVCLSTAYPTDLCALHFSAHTMAAHKMACNLTPSGACVGCGSEQQAQWTARPPHCQQFCGDQGREWHNKSLCRARKLSMYHVEVTDSSDVA
eukprot:733593-Pelagomonas_calceolata.AAC.6